MAREQCCLSVADWDEWVDGADMRVFSDQPAELMVYEDLCSVPDLLCVLCNIWVASR